jgi:hypothetical protein
LPEFVAHQEEVRHLVGAQVWERLEEESLTGELVAVPLTELRPQLVEDDLKVDLREPRAKAFEKLAAVTGGGAPTAHEGGEM